MIGSREIFDEIDTHNSGTIKFGNGSITKIKGKGSIVLTCKSGEYITLTRMYYISLLRASIISIGQLDEFGCHVDINTGILCIYDECMHVLTKVSWDESHLYHLRLNVGHPVYLVARTSKAAWMWHSRSGHLNFYSVRRLATQKMVCCMPMVDQVDQVYDSCFVGKEKHASFPAQA
jgi:hypothetical protein